MFHRFRPILFSTLAFAGSAFSLGSAEGNPALVGTSVSFYKSPICRQLGCVYQGVRRTRLEGSNNPVRVYRYILKGGQQIEVTRYNLPGQPGHELIYSVQYLRGTVGNVATTAARLASAAAGYPVTAAQVTPCFQGAAANGKQPRFIASRGFEAPGVLCSSSGSRTGVLIQLTN